jgi:exopolysaccharide production protein ExoZ
LRKLRSIQVLRAVAATAVVVHHFYAPEDAASPARLGAAGVDLFFVISGFIMATIAGDGPPLDFLRDRVRRIYPLWLISSLPLAYVFGTDFYQLLTTATLWPIWDSYHLPLNKVGWSLSYEMLFYCVFAIGLATRRFVPFLLFGVSITVGIMFSGVPLFRFLGDPMAIEFLAGVVIARLPLSERLGMFSLASGILLFALAPHVDPNVFTRPLALLRVAAWGIPSALIVYGARSLEPRFAGRAFWLPVLLGDASYSIYLFHFRVEELGLRGFAGAVLGVGLGVIVHRVLERPLCERRPDDRGRALSRLTKLVSERAAFLRKKQGPLRLGRP